MCACVRVCFVRRHEGELWTAIVRCSLRDGGYSFDAEGGLNLLSLVSHE